MTASHISIPTTSVAGGTGRVVPLTIPRPRVLLSDGRDARWRAVVMARLEELCGLPIGWDGYHAGPVKFAVAKFALDLIERVCDPTMPAPYIVPGSGGDLQIEWHQFAGDIELDVRAPNDVRAWRSGADSEKDGQELLLTNDFTEVARWVKILLEAPREVARTAA